MSKQEKVGKVTLDYEFYAGEDLYSDGEIEDSLLKIAQNCEEDELEKVIVDRNDWVYLYHFSQIRQNIVSWIPMEKKDKILEIGSGCGAITGALAKEGRQVDCVELSRKRSLINAYRNKNCDGITIKVANFEKIEPYLDDDYDVITLIGVWEYANLYLSSENPYPYFLQLLKKHLKPTGRIVIAIENQFGLKYWAGCREDHTGIFFEGLEGYPKTDGAKTFGKNQMQEIFEKEGLFYKFYYPYPDYKLPMCIYSDEYLPQKNELADNNKNLDNDRLLLFNEKEVFNTIIDNHMFPFFSNSFLVILRKNEEEKYDDVVGTKYYNERKKKFHIRTDIKKQGDGNLILQKIPLNKEAESHLIQMKEIYRTLSKMCHSSNIAVNPCFLLDNIVEIGVEQSTNMEQHLSLILRKDGEITAINHILQILNAIKKMASSDFVKTDAFRQVFGEWNIPEQSGIQGSAVNFLFENMYYKKNTVILYDYEWYFDFLIPVKFVLYRMISKLDIQKLNKDKIYEKCDINFEEQVLYSQMEEFFLRHYISGGKKLLAKSEIVKPKYVIDDVLINKVYEKKNAKVYFDYGKGFCEEATEEIPFYVTKKNTIQIPVNNRVSSIRFDPVEEAGVVKIYNICAVSQGNKKSVNYVTNGEKIGRGLYLFKHKDPWVNINIVHQEDEYIEIEFKIDVLSADIGDEQISNTGGKIKKIKRILRK